MTNETNIPSALHLQAGVDLSVDITEVTGRLRAIRRFALADQMQRASVSIPSNIAEGHGRTTRRDRRRFLAQSRGSAYELETQLEIARRMLKLSPAEIEPFARSLAKITAGLTKLIDADG